MASGEHITLAFFKNRDMGFSSLLQVSRAANEACPGVQTLPLPLYLKSPDLSHGAGAHPSGARTGGSPSRLLCTRQGSLVYIKASSATFCSATFRETIAKETSPWPRWNHELMHYGCAGIRGGEP